VAIGNTPSGHAVSYSPALLMQESLYTQAVVQRRGPSTSEPISSKLAGNTKSLYHLSRSRNLLSFSRLSLSGSLLALLQ
jgi:hypothetical protein